MFLYVSALENYAGTTNLKTWLFPTDLPARETCIFILAKIAIYRARCKDSTPHITHLMNMLKHEIETESKVAKLLGKQNNVQEKWGALRHSNT